MSEGVFRRILIIEDEEFLSEMYKIKFVEEGYEVMTANTGLEGIELAVKARPDVIFLDLVLPKMDGYEVLKKLKANPKTKEIKVYVLSNLGQNGEVAKGFARGADGYFIKANLTPSQLAVNVKKIFAGESVGLKNRILPGAAEEKTEKKAVATAPLKPIKKAKVLLIDDEGAIVEMYKIRLEKEGYEVAIAKNGAWGLRLAKEKKFDVIIMDMVMPAMDGCQAIKEIKSNPDRKAPIIVLSNSAQEKDIDEAIRSGAASYLLKSKITPAKLVKEIEKVLKR